MHESVGLQCLVQSPEESFFELAKTDQVSPQLNLALGYKQ